MQSAAGRHMSIVVLYWGRRGGGARMSIEIARSLAARDDLDLAVSVSSTADLYEQFRELEVPLHAIATPTSRRTAVTRLRSLVAGWIGFDRWRRAVRPDAIVITMGSPWSDIVSPLIRRGGVKVIRFVHDAAPHPGDRAVTPSWMQRLAMRYSDGCMTLSEHVRTQLIESGVPADRVWASRHGPFPVPSSPSAPRARHSPLRVLFFGRLAPYKGVDLLVEAGRILEREGVAVTIRIVGEGVAPDGELPGNTKVEQRWVAEDEIGDVLGWADVLALPYREASQSGVAPMAVAMGIPVIITPVGGLVEQVRDGIDGLHTGSVNASALAATIRRACDPEVYDILAREGSSPAAISEEWAAIGGHVVSAVRALCEVRP